MKTFHFQVEQQIPQPLDKVFEFFSDARNLEKLTPPWLQFEIVTPAPISMRIGTLIDYRLRIHRFPLRWQSEITLWDPPNRFVDEQRRGPYRLWVHEHTFRSQGEGTKVGDRVTYAMFGGNLVNRHFVLPDIEKIFAYRRQKLLEVFS